MSEENKPKTLKDLGKDMWVSHIELKKTKMKTQKTKLKRSNRIYLNNNSETPNFEVKRGSLWKVR